MATIYVASYGDGTASQANALAAYTATSTGDTLVFPQNGGATWSGTLNINRCITIDGNGTSLTGAIPLPNGLFGIAAVNDPSNLLRITNFNFNLVYVTGNAHAITSALVSNNVSISNLRIDHNTFKFGTLCLEIGGCYGVIDHNYFYNSRSSIETFAGTNAQAAASWANMAAGTAEAMFIEDNFFIDNADYIGGTTQPKMDGYNGGKIAIRYNTLNFSGCPPVESGNTAETIGFHGNAAGGVPANQGYWQQGSGARRGHSVMEIYYNIMTGRRIDFMYTARGGSSLVWNNTLITQGVGNERIHQREEEQIETSNWSPLRTGWPAEDQVHNSFYWGNTFDGQVQTADNVDVAADSTGFIQLNREYWLHAPEASGGYEYFSGLNGSTNTYPTNGVLYPTSGTMLFSGIGANAYYPYVPYTYPHPLTGPFFTMKRLGRHLKLKGLAII